MKLQKLRITEEKRELSKSKWKSRLVNFLTQIFPLARISLGLMSAISGVTHKNREKLIEKGTNFLPLKGVADGLGVILQVRNLCSNNANGFQILDDETIRSDDFYRLLKCIEYQAHRVANPNYDTIPESTRQIIQEKGTDLITAIVRFFNSALLYFSRSFAGEFNQRHQV